MLAWAREGDDPTRPSIPKWEDDPTRLPVAGLAVAVDTITWWWGLEGITDLAEGTPRSVGPIGAPPRGKGLHLEKGGGWPPAIPRMMAEQMGAAAAAVGSRTVVRWPHPRRQAEPVTEATVEVIHRTAGQALMAVRDILDDLKRHPKPDPAADHFLLWYFHQMRETAAAFPSRGWERCYDSRAFRGFNSSGKCGHLAVIELDPNRPRQNPRPPPVFKAISGFCQGL